MAFLPDMDHLPAPHEADSYLIANQCGYEIAREGQRIVFRNRRLMPYLHLSWFSGVLGGIFFLYLALMIYMQTTEDARDDFFIHLIVGAILFCGTFIPFLLFIRQYLKRRKMKPGTGPIRYTADLSQGVFLNDKGRILCSLSEMDIRITSAWDTYLAAGDDAYYEKLLFQWGGRFRSACVFKTSFDYHIRELVQRLHLEMFHSEKPT